MAAKKYRVFVSASEPSGDAHCAEMMKSVQKGGKDIEFVGVGGPLMEAAGCKLLETTVGEAAMAFSALGQIARFWKLIRKIREYLAIEDIDLVVVCDSPAFNFHVAKAAKKVGIRTVFYVAPQLWAWAAWRIRKIRKYCDQLCCILPFEVDWFGERGVEAAFVGNPLLDEFDDDFSGNIKDYRQFDPAAARIAIMPGSRNAELDSLWIPMQQIALLLKQKYPQVSFVAVAVDDERKELLKDSQIEGFECEYRVRSVVETARDVDLTLVASGSATLQVAAAGCPMVIMYQSSIIGWYLIGVWLIKTKYFSLVNILAGRELVPEFMPHFVSIGPIVQKCEELLDDNERLSAVSGELVELVQPMAKGRTCEKVARIVEQMCDG